VLKGRAVQVMASRHTVVWETALWMAPWEGALGMALVARNARNFAMTCEATLWEDSFELVCKCANGV
jgi:hypothetical protein